MLGKYRVEVMGKEPHDYVRAYTIASRDENHAAKEGMDKFISTLSEVMNEPV